MKLIDSQNFAIARHRKGLTQVQVASILGVAPQTISNWENGVANPTAERLLELCQVYQIEASQLITGFKVDTVA